MININDSTKTIKIKDKKLKDIDYYNENINEIWYFMNSGDKI